MNSPARRAPFRCSRRRPYLASGFASRLPEELRAAIRTHGIRNSHLLAIAPTGTISLAFADNASNGIEPAFSWSYTRRKRSADGSFEEYASRTTPTGCYRERGGNVAAAARPLGHGLGDFGAGSYAHAGAVQPYIDSSISKTVNVPADYPYADFQDLYLEAWKAG